MRSLCVFTCALSVSILAGSGCATMLCRTYLRPCVLLLDRLSTSRHSRPESDLRVHDQTGRAVNVRMGLSRA